MILLDVAKELKENHGYEEAQTADLVGVLRDGFEVIKNFALKEGEGFALQVPKFGTFKVIESAARTGFNPQTKEKIAIPAKLKFKLKTSSTLGLALQEVKPTKKKKASGKKKKKASGNKKKK